MCMTALAAEPIELVDKMNFCELVDVAERYGFYELVRFLKPFQVEEARTIVKQQIQEHNQAAYDGED